MAAAPSRSVRRSSRASGPCRPSFAARFIWDQGSEMSEHRRFSVQSGVEVYFCDPQSPWQRGSNEHTNGLLRQYFPKGTELRMHGAGALGAAAAARNPRPRKTLGWRTPAEAFDEVLRSAHTG